MQGTIRSVTRLTFISLSIIVVVVILFLHFIIMSDGFLIMEEIPCLEMCISPIAEVNCFFMRPVNVISSLKCYYIVSFFNNEEVLIRKLGINGSIAIYKDS